MLSHDAGQPTLTEFDDALQEARQGIVRTDQGFDSTVADLLQSVAAGIPVDERIVARIRGQLNPFLP